MGWFDVGPTIDRLSDDWMYSNLRTVPASWKGTNADLQTTIINQEDACAAFCHQQNPTHNTTNCRQGCKDKILLKYAPLLKKVQALNATEEAQLKTAALQDNKKTYAIVAIVLLVLLSIIILIKS